MILKRNSLIVIILTIISIIFLPAVNGQKNSNRPAPGFSFPDSIKCVVQPYYRHRPDGKPGREVILYFTGSGFSGKGTIDVICNGIKETTELSVTAAINKTQILLPPGCGVESTCDAMITLRSSGHELFSSVSVPAKRQWTD